MNVVQPIRGEKGATPIGLDANSHGTEHRAIVDTHRTRSDPSSQPKWRSEAFTSRNKNSRRPTLRTNRLSRVLRSGLRHAQAARGGVTLSLASNGGEVDWLARDLLQVSTGDTLKILNDEYLEIRDRYPGEFALMANATRWKRAVGRSSRR